MHVRTRLGLMTVASVAIVLAVGGTSYFSVQNLVSDEESLEHSHKVISEFHKLMFHLAATAADERGYLLTGQISYLEDYRGHAKLSPRVLQDVRELVKDNPNQGAVLDELSGVMDERLKSFDQSIAIYQSGGLADAANRVKTGQGTLFIEKIRNLEEQFEGEETRLLNSRNEEMRRSVRATSLSILAGALLSIAFVAVFNYFFGRHIVNSIRTLLVASENAENGRFNVVTLDAQDEFGELGDAFNQISMMLENSSEKLREASVDQAELTRFENLADSIARSEKALDELQSDLERAVSALSQAISGQERAGLCSTQFADNVTNAAQRSVSLFRTAVEVRRLLSITSENLSSLKQSLEECSGQADKLAGLQSELDNISNALEVISMSVDMTGPEGQPVLGAVMTRLHELSERCHEQRRTVGESISRMQTLLSRGMLTAHASSGAEKTSSQLVDGMIESIELLGSTLQECRLLSTDVDTELSSQVDKISAIHDELKTILESRNEQKVIIERLQQSVVQGSEDLCKN